jgi:hypothetical protein
MVFVGYKLGSKAYRAYDPRTGHVHITRNVMFDELAQWDWCMKEVMHSVIYPCCR